MCPSDVICLVSGLLSRQKQNEYCPHSHLHFLSSHTVKIKAAQYPIFFFFTKEKDKDMGNVWIYRDSIQKQTDCCNKKKKTFSIHQYSAFEPLLFSYQPKASALLQTTMLWPWNVRKVSKLILTKYSFQKHSSFPPFSLSTPSTFLKNYDRACSKSDSSPLTIPEKKQQQCMFILFIYLKLVIAPHTSTS